MPSDRALYFRRTEHVAGTVQIRQTTREESMKAASTPAQPRPAYLRAESGDFDEIALALKGLNADMRQMSRGAFRGLVEVVQLGPIQIMRPVLNRVVQVRGAVL